MKTFRDLEFTVNGWGGLNAKLKFDNGFTLSVVAGTSAYSTPREALPSPELFQAFEVAVFAPNGDWATRDFFPDHDDDVLGWQDRDEITELMSRIQQHNLDISN